VNRLTSAITGALAGAAATVLFAVLPATGAVAVALAAPTATARTPVDQVSVTTDRDHVDTPVGGRFTIRTRLVNHGDSATGPMLAHLNVASLTPDIYVDPEDWSTRRTQWIESLAPGQNQQLTWQLQAVNVGTFDSYVVLLPTNDPQSDTPPPVSRSIRLDVTSRQTISAGGVLPVVVAVPALLALLLAYRTHARTRRVPGSRPEAGVLPGVGGSRQR